MTSLVTFPGDVLTLHSLDLLPPAGTCTPELLPQVLSPVICVLLGGGTPAPTFKYYMLMTPKELQTLRMYESAQFVCHWASSVTSKPHMSRHESAPPSFPLSQAAGVENVESFSILLLCLPPTVCHLISSLLLAKQFLCATVYLLSVMQRPSNAVLCASYPKGNFPCSPRVVLKQELGCVIDSSAAFHISKTLGSRVSRRPF